jgi:hypothetical protein
MNEVCIKQVKQRNVSSLFAPTRSHSSIYCHNRFSLAYSDECRDIAVKKLATASVKRSFCERKKKWIFRNVMHVSLIKWAISNKKLSPLTILIFPQ